MIKGIPAAAVSAGWELASLIGPDIGNILAAVIFLLGASAVNISAQINDKKLTGAGEWIISLLYILVSVGIYHDKIDAGKNYIITLAAGIIDCVIMMLVINKAGKNKRNYFIKIIFFMAIWIITAITGISNFKAEILHPLLASFLTGTALIRIIASEHEANISWLFAGMAGAMLLDAVF